MVCAVAGLLIVLGLSGVLVSRARRLDRLHVRADLAASKLVALLESRRLVVDAAATSQLAHPEIPGHLSAVDQHAESDFSRQLAAQFPPNSTTVLATSLWDIDHSLFIRRSFYNDAVRDVHNLRDTRLVSWFKLAGRAPKLHYSTMQTMKECAEIAS